MASPLAPLGELGSLFAGIAGTDPISTVLLALGGLLTVGSVAVLGYLALGAAVDLLVPEGTGQVHRPRA